jgi:3-hydroxy-D-aspartate aldolase
MSSELALANIRAKQVEATMLPRPFEIEELPTPALIIDKPALEANVAKMSAHLTSHGKGFRPHAKTHKCPLISRMQIEAGAVGVCAAKVSEAAALLHGGVSKILITSPISTLTKARILDTLLLGQKNIRIVVDSLHGFELLAQAISADSTLGILVDLDVSMGRTGTRDNDLLLTLVERIEKDDRFYFSGVQHYAGHLMHLADFDKRREKSLSSWQRLEDKFLLLEKHGIDVDVVTGGGTGTYDIDVEVARMTDLQVGSYIFMDEEYRAIGSAQGDRFNEFELSLSVACTTISQPQSATITVDGGYKAFASDSVNPVCDDIPDVEFRFAGDEHGVLILAEGQQEIQLGQVIRFATPHCDPTVNLHEYYWVMEADGMVHSCWPITARGCSW